MVMDIPSSSSPVQLDLENLKAIKILGKGATGCVFLVHHTSTDPTARSPFALKVVQRSQPDHADRRALWELEVLTRLSPPDPLLHHPFLPRLLGRLQTPDFFAWAVPYCPGSDLHALRSRQHDRVFSPSVIQFYLAEIICALHHLHSLGIVYRDLKPENILIQHAGHVTLTDFDLSRNLNKKQSSQTLCNDKNDPNSFPAIPVRRKQRRNFIRWVPGRVADTKYTTEAYKKPKSSRVSPVSRRKQSFSNGDRSNSFVGTEEYVSPEVVRGDGHEFAVDWWALGILTYEMYYGTTPFKGNNRKETFRNVLYREPSLVGQRNDLTDLIGRLLQKDPTKRLGYHRGACEIKEHPFFNGVSWDLLTEVSRPPFIPSIEDGELTEIVEIDIMKYYESLKTPLSMPPSPSSEQRRDVSFSEF